MNDVIQALSRRRFLHRASLAGVGLCTPQWSMDTGAFAQTQCSSDASSSSFDCIVVGGTPGGIASAVTAARLGRSVALVEYHRHLGGMSASGLGKSDIENRAMIRGLFAEFIARVQRHYLTQYGADSENVHLLDPTCTSRTK